MNKRKIGFLLTILLVAALLMACGLFGGNNENNSSGDTADAPAADTTGDTSAGEESQDAPPSSAQEGAQVELGEDFRSEEGGYTIKKIPGWSFESDYGFTQMLAPGGNDDAGPIIFISGGAGGEESTPDQIFDEFMGDVDEGTEIVDRREIKVAGKPGITADIKGQSGEGEVLGQIVVVAVTPTQQFVLIGGAPVQRWKDEISPIFDALLRTVAFHEASSDNLFDDMEVGGETGIGDTTGEPAVDSEFPRPDDAIGVMSMEGMLNYQTTLTIPEIKTFYQDTFLAEGYAENTLLTNETETSLSMVFLGHPSGSDLVVQATDLGDGTVNVNVRLEN